MDSSKFSHYENKRHKEYKDRQQKEREYREWAKHAYRDNYQPSLKEESIYSQLMDQYNKCL